MVLLAAVHIGILKEGGIDTGAELDKPVFAAAAIIMIVAWHFLDHGEAFFLNHNGGILGPCCSAEKGDSSYGCQYLLFHTEEMGE